MSSLQSGTWERLEGLSSAPAIAEFYCSPTEGFQSIRAELWRNTTVAPYLSNGCPKCGGLKSCNGALCFDCAMRIKGELAAEKEGRRRPDKFCAWDLAW